MLRAGSSLATGTDLAAIANVPLQQCHILVVDVMDILATELADFRATGVTAAPWCAIAHSLVLLVFSVLLFNRRPLRQTRGALPIPQRSHGR